MKSARPQVRRDPAAMFLTLLLVFVAAGGLTIWSCEGYLSIFWRISEADWRAPGPNFAMVQAKGVISDFYRNGALYLDIDPRITAALRDADVVITGNSRTLNTFCLTHTDNQLDRYFQKKGLKFFIFAEDGSGFRYRKLILERLKIKPKIALMNTEDLAVDILEDFNKEIVSGEDRFRLPFRATHLAIEMQQAICKSTDDSAWMQRLKAFYCNGTTKSEWRNLETGGDFYAGERKNTKREQVLMKPDTYLGYLDMYRRRLKSVLESEGWRDSRFLFYEIPNPNMMNEVSQILAKENDIPFIFPEVTPEKQYWVHDGSHLEVDSSKRWTEEFLKALDPHLDRVVAELKSGSGRK
jgi:hypothetical protein